MRFFVGLIVGVLLVPLFGYFYFRFGYAPVATASSPMPFEKSLAHIALNARIEKDAPKRAPFSPVESDFMTGAQLYVKHCAVCHGIAEKVKTATQKGMFPQPPFLVAGKGVTDDPAGETYWKVSNGIRLTGMPAYSDSLTPKEMWQISLMLAGADKLSGNVQAVLKQPLQQQ